MVPVEALKKQEILWSNSFISGLDTTRQSYYMKHMFPYSLPNPGTFQLTYIYVFKYVESCK